jgi:nicotinate-nucleotide adenylyltransferase
MNIGIFPGTFDPIHSGHLSFALEAVRAHNLDMVYLLPEGFPRGKPNASVFSERLTQIEAAIQQYTHLSVLVSPFPRSSTIETLPWLTTQFPTSSLTLLIGSDVAAHLSSWNNLPELTQTVSFIVGMRSGDSQSELALILQQAQERHCTRIDHTFLTAAHADLSSSKIRATQ